MRDVTLSRSDFLGAAAAVGFALTGGAAAARAGIAATPRRGGLAQLAVSGFQTDHVLDPAMGGGVFEIIADGLLYDTLVTFNDRFEVKPGLATSWQVNSNATEWVFHLRPGVEFHDGTPLTAADVAYSVARQLDPKLGSYIQGALSRSVDASGIQALDKQTIRFALKRPNAFFPTFLAGFSGGIVKRGWTLDSGDPIGTGPFRFKRFVPAEIFEADRNPGYWQQGKPYLDAVRIVHVPEQSTKVQSVLSGQAQLGDQMEFALAKTVQQSGSADVLRQRDGLFPVLAFDQRLDSRYKNPDVIRALKMVIDRPAYLAVVARGFGSIGADLPIPRSDPFYPKGFEPIAHDPDGARKLLQKAGFKDLKVTLSTSQVGAGMVDSAVLFAAQARKAGIRVQVKQAPAPTYWSTTYLKVPAFVSLWARQHTSNIMSDTMASFAPYNESGYKDHRIDHLIFAAYTTSSSAKQKQLWAEAFRRYAAHAGWIVPVWFDTLYPVRKELKDVQLTWTNFLDLRAAYLA